MAKASGGTRTDGARRNGERDYYKESMRFRKEALEAAEVLKGNPEHFSFNNVISGQMEITKSDIKTIVSKKTKDNKFNAFKNLLAKDIHGFIVKAKYEGYREVVKGKHSETAYFVYYSRELQENAYLCVRRMKGSGIYKPYAIINQNMFNAEVGSLQKGKPPK